MNLSLPGNPRYQPKSLQEVFGYDRLYRPAVEVELAVMITLGEMGVIPQSDIALLTPEIRERLLVEITTTMVDKVEREETKHDVRALVRLIQDIIPAPLRRWVHVPLTSYDVLDTARALQFKRAHEEVVWPALKTVMRLMALRVRTYALDRQIGRTHGQHALPITVGFWLATILDRITANAAQMNRAATKLTGKISGAVGAHNAQVALGLSRVGDKFFEEVVLGKLGLKPAPISTQIVPPEPLANYLWAAMMLSASLGQLGRDCRHLMRSEIGELYEPFEQGQVGSSTMAHKRNPINFESLEGMWLRNSAEFGKVMSTLISDHQRDLVGSSLLRDLPIIIVNLTTQLNTLTRENKKGKSFLMRLRVDTAACHRNLKQNSGLIMAEPIYIALQMAGYGDAHKLVNERAVPICGAQKIGLLDAIRQLAQDDHDLAAALDAIPEATMSLLDAPMDYIGTAGDQALAIAEAAEVFAANQ